MLKIDPNTRVVRFLRDPWNRLAADIIPVLTAAYFTFKKLADFEAEKLLDGFLTEKGTGRIIGLGLAIIAYATILKVALLVIDKFEVHPVKDGDYSSLLRLYKKNNLEIEQHLTEVNLPTFNKQAFQKFQAFEQNIYLLILSLHEHLLAFLSSQSDAAVKRRDLLISFYEYDPVRTVQGKGKCFKLTAHFDPAVFPLKTLEIFTSDKTYECFAGVKALNDGETICIFNCSDGRYVKGGVKRRKHIKHYFGVPMEIGKERVGLLNIEIHNKECFSSKNQMEEFFSEHLYPFKCLFEYQLLKRDFFTQIATRITP